MNSSNIKLTQYSHGGGCGCKISPKDLEIILHSNLPKEHFPNLVVGNESRDDAAIVDVGNNQGIVSTTDFFMPIVDDPETFGRIAAVNALSDIYAMGARPLMAISILGWPVNKIPFDVASAVVDGGRLACKEAGIPLCGGHSIDSPEPIFGLAVTGIVQLDQIKKNCTAKAGCKIYLTKPLGVGLLTTAEKKCILKPESSRIAINTMTQLNDIGVELGQCPEVLAMTDVTGFGLLGHFMELCEGSALIGRLQFGSIPTLPEFYDYVDKDCTPGGTQRNYDSYGHKVQCYNLKTNSFVSLTKSHIQLLCDPQTSGGLLIAVESGKGEEKIKHIFKKFNIHASCLQPIGILEDKSTEINNNNDRSSSCCCVIVED